MQLMRLESGSVVMVLLMEVWWMEKLWRARVTKMSGRMGQGNDGLELCELDGPAKPGAPTGRAALL